MSQLVRLLRPANSNGLRLNFTGYGRALPAAVANTAALPEAERELCPAEWLDLSAMLVTLIEDEGMTTEQAAKAAGVPVWFVAEYRRQMDI